MIKIVIFNDSIDTLILSNKIYSLSLEKQYYGISSDTLTINLVEEKVDLNVYGSNIENTVYWSEAIIKPYRGNTFKFDLAEKVEKPKNIKWLVLQISKYDKKFLIPSKKLFRCQKES